MIASEYCLSFQKPEFDLNYPFFEFPSVSITNDFSNATCDHDGQLQTFFTNFDASVSSQKTEISSEVWVQKGMNSDTFQEDPNGVEILKDEEVILPLFVHDFEASTSNQCQSLTQTRRGRKKKDWNEIKRNLSIHCDPDLRRKIKNNLSSAQYRMKKTLIAQKNKEELQTMEEVNLNLSKKLAFLKQTRKHLETFKRQEFNNYTEI